MLFKLLKSKTYPNNCQKHTSQHLQNTLCFANIAKREITKHSVFRDFTLPPRCPWDLHSSGVLRGVEWWSFTVVSAQHIGSVFKDQQVQLKMGPTGRPETSVQNCHPTLRNIPEERRFHTVFKFTWWPFILRIINKHCGSEAEFIMLKQVF
jgi:hypothetical protein